MWLFHVTPERLTGTHKALLDPFKGKKRDETDSAPRHPSCLASDFNQWFGSFSAPKITSINSSHLILGNFPLSSSVVPARRWRTDVHAMFLQHWKREQGLPRIHSCDANEKRSYHGMRQIGELSSFICASMCKLHITQAGGYFICWSDQINSETFTVLMTVGYVVKTESIREDYCYTKATWK